MVGLGRREARLGARHLALLELLYDCVGVGPAAAEEALEEALVASGDELSVNEDVELAAGARSVGGFDSGVLLDVSGETRRSLFVASAGAIEDFDLHLVTCSCWGSGCPRKS